MGGRGWLSRCACVRVGERGKRKRKRGTGERERERKRWFRVGFGGLG